MGLFSKPKKTAEAVKPATVHTGGALVVETFNVAGVYYHEKSIKQLQIPAEDWKKSPEKILADGKVMQKIFRYTYIESPVRLVPEPTNPHDRNAVKVMIAGAHVGYIPSEKAKHYRAVLKNSCVKTLTATIKGGEYKIVSQNGDSIPWDESISITVHIEYTTK